MHFSVYYSNRINGKFKGEKKCTTSHLYEDDIKDLFITALSTLLSDR